LNVIFFRLKSEHYKRKSVFLNVGWEGYYGWRSPWFNRRFAKAGVSCFYDSEVLNSSFVHLMKFSAENPRLRKAAKRCASYKIEIQ